MARRVEMVDVGGPVNVVGIAEARLGARDEGGSGEERPSASARVYARHLMLNGAKPVGSCHMGWRPFLMLMSDPAQTVFVQDSTTVTKILISVAARREARGEWKLLRAGSTIYPECCRRSEEQG